MVYQGLDYNAVLTIEADGYLELKKDLDFNEDDGYFV